MTLQNLLRPTLLALLCGGLCTVSQARVAPSDSVAAPHHTVSVHKHPHHAPTAKTLHRQKTVATAHHHHPTVAPVHHSAKVHHPRHAGSTHLAQAGTTHRKTTRLAHSGGHAKPHRTVAHAAPRKHGKHTTPTGHA